MQEQCEAKGKKARQHDIYSWRGGGGNGAEDRSKAHNAFTVPQLSLVPTMI